MYNGYKVKALVFAGRRDTMSILFSKIKSDILDEVLIGINTKNQNDIEFIDTEDGTVVYVKDSEHNVYKQAFKDNESLIKINKGDYIEVTYQPSEDGINYMTE